jgi:hypothetical protein
MTPETAVQTPGTINRFEVFHHYRKRNPEFYLRFETAVQHILARRDTPLKVGARVLQETILRDFPLVRTFVPTESGLTVDVFKAMLSWFRYKNPSSVGRFRVRRTERSRNVNNTHDWEGESLRKVRYATICLLVLKLKETMQPHSMALLKQAAGVKFNQNYNAEVAKYIRDMWPEVSHLIPSRRPRVR